jgi:hypothetical protein
LSDDDDIRIIRTAISYLRDGYALACTIHRLDTHDDDDDDDEFET